MCFEIILLMILCSYLSWSLFSKAKCIEDPVNHAVQIDCAISQSYFAQLYVIVRCTLLQFQFHFRGNDHIIMSFFLHYLHSIFQERSDPSLRRPSLCWGYMKENFSWRNAAKWWPFWSLSVYLLNDPSRRTSLSKSLMCAQGRSCFSLPK